jgi:hypothetical protein
MQCGHCGYDLTGLKDIVCPECGTDLLRHAAVPVARSDLRFKCVVAAGAAGWLTFVGELIAIMARVGAHPVALFCPGIPMMMALACLVPWVAVLGRVRYRVSGADEVFVSCFPWLLAALFVMLAWLAI